MNLSMTDEPSATETTQRAQEEVVGQQWGRVLARSQPGGQAVAGRHGRGCSSGRRRIRRSPGKFPSIQFQFPDKLSFRRARGDLIVSHSLLYDRW